MVEIESTRGQFLHKGETLIVQGDGWRSYYRLTSLEGGYVLKLMPSQAQRFIRELYYNPELTLFFRSKSIVIDPKVFHWLRKRKKFSM